LQFIVTFIIEAMGMGIIIVVDHWGERKGARRLKKLIADIKHSYIY